MVCCYRISNLAKTFKSFNGLTLKSSPKSIKVRWVLNIGRVLIPFIILTLFSRIAFHFSIRKDTGIFILEELTGDVFINISLNFFTRWQFPLNKQLDHYHQSLKVQLSNQYSCYLPRHKQQPMVG